MSFFIFPEENFMLNVQVILDNCKLAYRYVYPKRKKKYIVDRLVLFL